MQIITTHISADFDALASMLAAKKLYPEARLVFPGAQERNVQEFLQWTEYSFEFAKVKNIPLEEVELLVLVDVKLASRIGPFADLIGRPGLRIHIYDHHPSHPKDIKGEIEVLQEVGATTTLFVDLLRRRRIPLSPQEASILLLGIYEDTGMLTFSSTTPEDLEAAAYLLSQGGNLVLVSDFVKRELTEEQISLLNDLLQEAETHLINGVEVVIATASRQKYVGDLAFLAHKYADMKHPQVLIFLVQMDNKVHMVVRSRSDMVDASAVAEEFGGGGHPTAASASIKDLSLMQVRERLLKALREKIIPVRLARDLMTAPLKCIEKGKSLQEAQEIMLRSHVSTLPVIDSSGKLHGLISRQIVERAILHGLGSERVDEYMTREFPLVQPDTPYPVLENYILEQRQKFLPVVEMPGRVLVGAVTRGDFLAFLREDMRKKERFPEEELFTLPLAPQKNLHSLIRERLPEQYCTLLEMMAELADRQGVSLYVVGGFVRDLLLRVENFDLDLVIEGDAFAFARLAAKRLKGKVRGPSRFGTAVLLLPDGTRVDIATARREYYPHPAALPEVEVGSIKQDLYRRDFTINALAIKLSGPNKFHLIDFFGGRRDIKERIIRVLHNLSFVEDPTRIFRAIRFEQRFNFTIGKHTLSLMKSAIEKGLCARLSGKRLWQELKLILQEREPIRPLKRMAEFTLLSVLHPALQWNEEKERLFKKVEQTLAWYELSFLDEKIDAWKVYFLALVSDMNDEHLQALLHHLRPAEPFARDVVEERRRIERIWWHFAQQESLPPSAVDRLLRPLSLESILYLMAKLDKECAKRHISLYLTQLRRVQIATTGKELIQLGLQPGPLFGKILAHLREAKLDGKVHTAEEELAFVRTHYLAEQPREGEEEGT
ncbi:MAG: CBS domain-containing protein [Nitrospinota bacterium]|nr:MAG: CBS domain-containing protein [Nitrospinota bacterium]